MSTVNRTGICNRHYDIWLHPSQEFVVWRMLESCDSTEVVYGWDATPNGMCMKPSGMLGSWTVSWETKPKWQIPTALGLLCGIAFNILVLLCACISLLRRQKELKGDRIPLLTK